jgi:hypothetical protein
VESYTAHLRQRLYALSCSLADPESFQHGRREGAGIQEARTEPPVPPFAHTTARGETHRDIRGTGPKQEYERLHAEIDIPTGVFTEVCPDEQPGTVDQLPRTLQAVVLEGIGERRQ